MRKKAEILSLPIGELSDEEAVKALHYRFGGCMTMFAYCDNTKQIHVFYRYTGKFGRAYWSRLSTPVMRLWDKISVSIEKRFNEQFNFLNH